MEVGALGQRLHDVRAQEADQADSDVEDAHGFAAVAAEPVGDHKLMRNGAGKNVADRVEEPARVIDPERAVHGSEADERRAGEGRAHQDQLARAEARHQYRPDPQRQQRREREAKGDLFLAPVEFTLEVVVEERHVVVGQTYRYAERQEGRRRDPPAVKCFAAHRMEPYL